MPQILVFFGVLFTLFVFYDLLPNYYARHRTRLVKKEIFTGNKNKVIALTFDDGPDKRYTGQVLDILKEYHVKATFFIVAKNAHNNLELVERMKDEGHDIAMHAYQHKSAWVSFPWETKREFDKSLQFFNSIERPMRSFRPPWGTFNAVSLRFAIKNGLDVVLWTVEAFDWRKNNSPQQIAQEILDRIQNRGIIVLHDSGGAEEAPQHTIDALKLVVPQLIDEGYQFITIKEGMKQDARIESVI